MKASVRIPKIPKEEKSPIVSQLLEIIEQQFVTVRQQARLGGHPAM
jgi:starvation-inducible outer membrane lipoprotein